MTRKRLAIALAAVLLVPLALVGSSGLWLTALGRALVENGKPSKADGILVLAGDWKGKRILKACELMQQGLAPVVLVSGSFGYFDLDEADIAIRFATRHGCPAERLHAVTTKATSTVSEAQLVKPEILKRGIRDLIVVTSNFHTARSGRVYRDELGDSVRVQVVAAPDQYFEPGGWWHTREGRKTVFFEVSKTIAQWIGL